MTINSELTTTLNADLLDCIQLDAEGQPFDDADPAMWAAADAAEPEFASRGAVRFRIIDPDAADLSRAAGAIDADSPPTTCMLVEFDIAEGQPQPAMGQYIVLEAAEGVYVVFYVWLTHADLHDPAAPDLGISAIRNEALASLEDRPGRALLMQVFDSADEPEAV